MNPLSCAWPTPWASSPPQPWVRVMRFFCVSPFSCTWRRSIRIWTDERRRSKGCKSGPSSNDSTERETLMVGGFGTLTVIGTGKIVHRATDDTNSSWSVWLCGASPELPTCPGLGFVMQYETGVFNLLFAQSHFIVFHKVTTHGCVRKNV